MAGNPANLKIALTKEEEESIKNISLLIGNLFSCCKNFKTNQKTRDRVVELVAQYYAALREKNDFELMMLQALKAHSNHSEFDTLCAMILYADRQLKRTGATLSKKLVEKGIITNDRMEKILENIQPDSNNSSVMEVAPEIQAEASDKTTNPEPLTTDNSNFTLTMFCGLCKIVSGVALIVVGLALGGALMALGIPSFGVGFVGGVAVMSSLGSTGGLAVLSGLEDFGFFGDPTKPAKDNLKSKNESGLSLS